MVHIIVEQRQILGAGFIPVSGATGGGGGGGGGAGETIRVFNNAVPLDIIYSRLHFTRYVPFDFDNRSYVLTNPRLERDLIIDQVYNNKTSPHVRVETSLQLSYDSRQRSIANARLMTSDELEQWVLIKEAQTEHGWFSLDIDQAKVSGKVVHREHIFTSRI